MGSRLGEPALVAIDRTHTFGRIVACLGLVGLVVSPVLGQIQPTALYAAFGVVDVAAIVVFGVLAIRRVTRATRLVVAHCGLPPSAAKTLQRQDLVNPVRFDSWLARQQGKITKS